ncbi:MAG: (d)CMP kinase [Thermodesulfovibrionia bacterium]|nr:(d)CMP kinase [Thermodesulfovibrionia bacterium]
MKNVITIDGPSGSGKGTVSRIVAERLGYNYLDTGALYRAVAWKTRQESVDPDNEAALKKILGNINIAFSDNRIYVDGIDVSLDIRTAEIGELSSRVSAMPVVREGLFSLQRDICLKGKVVIEGRDTGTAIFPESENKFYLDAGIEERARRRFEELKIKDPDITMEQTIEDIKKRDNRDSSRESSPMKKTDDMVYIDSTDLSIEKVVKKIITCLK